MLIALIGLFGWLYLLFYALNQEHSWGYNMLSTPSPNSKDRWTDRCSVGYDEDNGFAKNYTLPCEAYKLSKNSSIANGVLNIKISLDGEVLPSLDLCSWERFIGSSNNDYDLSIINVSNNKSQTTGTATSRSIFWVVEVYKYSYAKLKGWFEISPEFFDQKSNFTWNDSANVTRMNDNRNLPSLLRNYSSYDANKNVVALELNGGSRGNCSIDVKARVAYALGYAALVVSRDHNNQTSTTSSDSSASSVGRYKTKIPVFIIKQSGLDSLKRRIASKYSHGLKRSIKALEYEIRTREEIKSTLSSLMWTFVTNHKSIDAYTSVYKLINRYINYQSSVRSDSTMNLSMELSLLRKNDSLILSEKDNSKRLKIFHSIYLVLYIIAFFMYVGHLALNGNFYKWNLVDDDIFFFIIYGIFNVTITFSLEISSFVAFISIVLLKTIIFLINCVTVYYPINWLLMIKRKRLCRAIAKQKIKSFHTSMRYVKRSRYDNGSDRYDINNDACGYDDMPDARVFGGKIETTSSSSCMLSHKHTSYIMVWEKMLLVLCASSSSFF